MTARHTREKDEDQTVSKMSQDDIKRLRLNHGRNIASVAAGTRYASEDDRTPFMSLTPEMKQRAEQAGVMDAAGFARRLGMGYAEFMSTGITSRFPPDIDDGKLKLWKRDRVEAYAQRIGR